MCSMRSDFVYRENQCSSHALENFPLITRSTFDQQLHNVSTIFFIEVQLIYSIMLISALQQSDSVYHGILNRIPCAMQQDLAVYPFHIQWLASANPKTPNPSLFYCPLPHGQLRRSVLYVLESVSILQIGSFVLYFRFHM